MVPFITWPETVQRHWNVPGVLNVKTEFAPPFSGPQAKVPAGLLLMLWNMLSPLCIVIAMPVLTVSGFGVKACVSLAGRAGHNVDRGRSTIASLDRSPSCGKDRDWEILHVAVAGRDPSAGRETRKAQGPLRSGRARLEGRYIRPTKY